MTPNFTQFLPKPLNFGSLKGRKVIADFSGGIITSDAGIVLMVELDKKLKITSRFAECFQDYRAASYVDYSVHQLLAQRVWRDGKSHQRTTSAIYLLTELQPRHLRVINLDSGYHQ